MTYMGYNPTGMPTDTPRTLLYPEVKAPKTDGRGRSRSDA
jgi:hypothetical protein